MAIKRSGTYVLCALLVAGIPIAAVFTTGCRAALEQGLIPAVSEASFEEEVLKAPGVVVVDIWAAWCVPCKVVRPRLEALAKEYQGRVKVCAVDYDRAPKIAAAYKIEGLPSVLLFKAGVLQDLRVGVRSKEEYAAWFEEHL